MIEDRASVIKNNLTNKLPYDLINLTALILCELLGGNSWVITIARVASLVKMKTIFSFIHNFRQMFIETAN
jgi:hypothetical protein